MAINWQSGNGAVMYAIGKLVKNADLIRTWGLTTYPGYRDEVIEAFDTNETEQVASGFYDKSENHRRFVNNILSDYGTLAKLRLLDRATVVDQLTLPDSSEATKIVEAIKDFNTQSQTVTKNVCTVPLTATANGANYGNGKIYLSALLDGVTPPHPGFPSSPLYVNVLSELVATSETLAWTCIRDSQRDGVTEGSETFQLAGAFPQNLGLTCFAEYGGQGPTVNTAQSDAINANGGFESYDVSSGFSNWTINGGALGTTVTAESSTQYRGTYALKLVGTGALATHSLYQTLPTGFAKPTQGLWLCARVKATSTIAAGDLAILLTGTGYTAGSTEKISIAAASLPTSWTGYAAWIPLPTLILSDLAIQIQITGTLTAAKNVWVDDVYLVKATYWGGCTHLIQPGSTRFMSQDRFTAAISNSDAGLFQRFSKRLLKRQWPSTTDDAATCPNSLYQ